MNGWMDGEMSEWALKETRHTLIPGMPGCPELPSDPVGP